MIHIVKRAGLFLLFDDMKGSPNGAYYRIASTSKSDARATIPRANFTSNGDWLDEETLARALAVVKSNNNDQSQEL